MLYNGVDFSKYRNNHCMFAAFRDYSGNNSKPYKEKTPW